VGLVEKEDAKTRRCIRQLVETIAGRKERF
jgi:hypothetical protein